MRLERLRIAARTSDLARVQAFAVGAELQRAHPGLEVTFEFRKSLGDVNNHDPLWKMPEKGVFTEDFKHDLLAGTCDLVVHSWKDLPVEAHAETKIAATLPREDVRDLLLLKNSVRAELEAGTRRSVKILSSSPRRAYNLGPFFAEALPHPAGAVQVEFFSVRGNIPTRLQKLLSQSEDGLIVAKAALDRLLSVEGEEWAALRSEIRAVLREVSCMVLPISQNPAAAAQGALAIEIRRDRADVAELLAPIHCAETFRAVERERATLKSYGGGCHQKIGVTCLPRNFGEVFSLRGLTDQGEVLAEFRIERPGISPNRVPLAQLWPATKDELFPVFSRTRLTVENPGGALWISKAEALPEDWNVRENTFVWTSGIETWRKLAARGVWVHGSADSLGESEPMRLETLIPSAAVNPRVTKLSHTGGPAENFSVLATYALALREWSDAELNLRFSGKTHFFWMSASLFQALVKRLPWIREAQHAAGPGNTSRLLSEILGREVSVYADLHQWHSECAETK